jgi:DNA-binding NarL/FixJ family response regulator
MLAAAAAQDRAGSIIEIQALRALALAAAGDQDAAVDVLAAALTLACPQGYVRVFADEGPPMAALLGRLVAAQKTGRSAARGVDLGCLARVLRAFGGKDDAQGAGRDAAAVPGLAEQLTARELEILVLLAAGMPNPRIAEQLVVTVDTVKKHVSHLLGKLGAANRTEAGHPRPPARPDPLATHRSRPPGGTAVPRAGPVALSCPAAGCGRFHPHAHLRVTPHGGAESYRPRERSANRAGPLPAAGARTWPRR